MKIGFIGAGKLGSALGHYCCERKIHVTGYYSRRIESAKKAAAFTQTAYFSRLKEIVEVSDTLLITTPDDVIKIVWDCIKQLPIENKIICHCSGTLSSTVFSEIENHRAYGYSIHPLYAISEKTSLEKAFFTLEGHEAKMGEVKALMEQLGNPYKLIQKQHKTLYHIAAVTASNMMIGLMDQAVEDLMQCGFEREEAEAALKPLIEGNMAQLRQEGMIQALTGPIERNDVETVAKHLEVLQGERRELYCLLAKRLIKVAHLKNPHRDYNGIKNIGGMGNETNCAYI